MMVSIHKPTHAFTNKLVIALNRLIPGRIA
jgi:hypothetical protein